MVLLFVALLTITQVQATNRKHHRHQQDGKQVEKITERMASELNLTDAQKAKVLDLNTRYADIFRHQPRYFGKPIPVRPEDMKRKELQGKGQAADSCKAAAKQDCCKCADKGNCCKAQGAGGKGKPHFDKRKGGRGAIDMKVLNEKREAYNAELKTILDKDQYAKYEEQQKQRIMLLRGGQGQVTGKKVAVVKE